MNILVILGISSFIAPLPFSDSSYIDLSVGLMGPIALLLLSLVWTKNSIGKKDGMLLMGIYLIYLAYLVYIELY